MKGWLARFSTILGLIAPVCACSSLPASINPVEWWHGLQGGAIAQQRPPPPGADQPYPNLASVPSKPPAPDKQKLQQINEALVGDRANAQYAAAQAPLPNPPSASGASPAPFGQSAKPPPPPPNAAEGATAQLAAATAPPAPPTQHAEAPNGAAAGPASSAPLAPPPGAETPGSTTPRDTAALPPLPGAPPPPPSIEGAPSGPTAPNPLPVAPKPKPAPPAPPHLVGEPVPVAFERGSAALPADSRDVLKQLAAKRNGATIEVTGFGEAASADPLAQSAALGLALNRAESMAAALGAAGVPAGSVRITAEAAGRGGVARLIQ